MIFRNNLKPRFDKVSRSIYKNPEWNERFDQASITWRPRSSLYWVAGFLTLALIAGVNTSYSKEKAKSRNGSNKNARAASTRRPAKSIDQRLGALSTLSGERLSREVKDLASSILVQGKSSDRATQAGKLALLSMGSVDRTTLQVVTEILERTIIQLPQKLKAEDAWVYDVLAQLERYQGMDVSLRSKEFSAALAVIDKGEALRRRGVFTFKDLEGKSVELRVSEFKGKIVVLDFWATWCGPCVEELPLLSELAKKYGEDEFVVIGISPEKAKTVSDFLKNREPLGYRVLLDPDQKMFERLNFYGYPSKLIYNRDGSLNAGFFGAKSKEEWEALFLRVKLTGVKNSIE